MITPTDVSLPGDDHLPALGSSERAYVFAVAMKYVKNAEEAEDVTQDALLLAHRHRHTFRGDARFSTWLYRIAASAALMHLRKKRRREREVAMSVAQDQDEEARILDTLRDDRAGPDVQLAHGEAMATIARGLSELGDKYRHIFWMRYFEGYTETEIAVALDLTLATVKTRAHRARVMLQASLRAAA
jgi:RNA polymerase sigma-70 factor (ECF subfamily)